MTQPNKLTSDPPQDVMRATSELGENLKIARLRRGLTISQVADRIGTGPRAVADAEQGKLSTSIAIYVALLREYDFLFPFFELASPYTDTEGLRLLNMSTSSRAKKINEDAPRFRSSRENYFLSYHERHDSLDEGY